MIGNTKNGLLEGTRVLLNPAIPSILTTMINYDARVFRSVANSDGGDVGNETVFQYHQRDDIVWATYGGGSVRFGTLVAKVDSSGSLDMRYQHVALDGAFKSGHCHSRPEVLADGRIRLHERWQWTDGAAGEGASMIEEVATPTAGR